MFISTKEFHQEAVRQNIEGSDNKLVSYKSHYYISNVRGRVISDRYDFISKFLNGLAVCQKNDKRGIINSDGTIVIPLKYDNCYVDQKAIRISKNSKWGIANIKGRTFIKPTYPFIEAFNKNISRFKSPDGKWGIIDKRGKIILPPIYSYLGDIKDGKMIARVNMVYGVIDTKKNEIHPFKFRRMNIINGVSVLSDSLIKGDNEVVKIS